MDHERDEAGWARVIFGLRYPDGFACRRCGHRRASQLRSRPRVFGCQACRTHHSVTAGTPLHGCKLPLAIVVRAIRLVVRRTSISARRLARELEIGTESAWTLAHRLRDALGARPPSLRGPVVLTEIAVAMRDVAPLLPKKRREVHPVVLVATDRDYRAACALTTDRWFAPSGLVRTCSDQRTYETWQPSPVANWIGTVLQFTHRLVSARWLANYVGALAATQSSGVDGEHPVEATLRAVVRRPGRGFVAIVPPKNYWHPSYRPLVTPVNPVRLLDLQFPIHRRHRVVLRRGYFAPSPTPDPT